MLAALTVRRARSGKIGRVLYHWQLLNRGVILPTVEEAEALEAPLPPDFDYEASSSNTIASATPTQPSESAEEEEEEEERVS